MNRKKPLLRKAWVRKVPKKRGTCATGMCGARPSPREREQRIPEPAALAGPYSFKSQMGLFLAKYKAQGFRCAITNEPLLGPGNSRFHCQGSHLLPKGSYPSACLWWCNLIMILPEQHDKWTNTGNKWDLVYGNDKIEPDARWEPHVRLYEWIQRYYNLASRHGNQDSGGPVDPPGIEGET